MKKNILFMMFSFLLVSTNVSAYSDSILESECHSTNGTNNRHFLKDMKIELFTISTITDVNFYGFSIGVGNRKYKVILKSSVENAYRDQFSSTARMAKVLNLPVNICVDNLYGDGYLLGIEFS